MTTTTNKGYDLPARGSDVNVWDVPVNGNMGIIDKNFGGVLSVALTNTNVTLSATDAQNAIIVLTGGLTGNVSVTLPAVGSSYFINNQTGGNYTVTLIAGAGQRIATPQGVTTQVYTDGSNVNFSNLGNVGEYWDYCGTTVPNWVTACTVPPYLHCDGSGFSAVTYPNLAGILGSTILPDARGRARFALNEGTGRLSAAGGIGGDIVGNGGGTSGLVMIQANLPNLLLPISGTAPFPIFQVVNLGAGGATIYTYNNPNNTTGQITGTVSTGGSSTPMPNVPPGYVGGITMIRAA